MKKQSAAFRVSLEIATLITIAFLGAPPRSFAQTNAQRNDALMTALQKATPKLGGQQKYLSGGLLNALNIAQHWDTLKARLAAAKAAGVTVRSLASTGVTTSGLASRITGFTQSETSTAWCGTHAVIGFNDTGSYLETENLATGGLSLMGYAQSINASGKTPTFTDMGPVPSGPGLFVASDPVVGCDSTGTFYLSGVGLECLAFVQNGNLVECAPLESNVTVSVSNPGGATFGSPNVAVTKDFTTHTLDKDWMAIDTVNNIIYVTYTDFDTSSPNICGFDDSLGFPVQIERVAIEIVSSTDGGMTWSAPTEVSHVCADPFANPNSALTGSQIAIASDGSVYVAWEAIGPGGADPSVREIDIAKSAMGGTSFAGVNKVTSVNCAGDCVDGILQGSIRILELPSLVIGKGSQSGKLFITWNDGDNPQPDVVLTTYNFADVKLVSSSDGGVT